MMDLIDTNFIHVGLTVPDQAGLFDAMAAALVSGGRVRSSFRKAIEDREAVFPTGLPVGCGVAIPHTDAEHVIDDAISVATLESPVPFGEMAGEPGAQVGARVIIMLALGSGAQVEVLTRVVKAIQSNDFLDSLLRARDPAEVADLAKGAFLP